MYYLPDLATRQAGCHYPGILVLMCWCGSAIRPGFGGAASHWLSTLGVCVFLGRLLIGTAGRSGSTARCLLGSRLAAGFGRCATSGFILATDGGRSLLRGAAIAASVGSKGEGGNRESRGGKQQRKGTFDSKHGFLLKRDSVDHRGLVTNIRGITDATAYPARSGRRLQEKRGGARGE